jgi:murein DD-endopeptidase MepM/ murein hydrolase activator NlpD
VANLNLARSADVEIAESLKSINEEANLTIEKIAIATERIEVAQAIAAQSVTEVEESGDRQRQIETALMVKAVEGFKTRSLGGEPAGIFGEATANETLRQNQLLDEASSSTTELLEELRTLLEDRQYANSQAQQAAQDALNAEKELQEELAKLKEQQTVQVGLKVEAERRINQWASELTAYAQEDAAIQALISENAAPAVVNTAINNPTTPSALGFQWPVEAPVTSEYGYRNHPVFGKRKFHNGIDLGAARGTPVAASNDGVVIFAGARSGYGNTVIVDHGGGITTLYAHLSELGSTDGQTVARGDIVGFVGKTGTATGYHLHFEVRVNGGSANPRNYLP